MTENSTLTISPLISIDNAAYYQTFEQVKEEIALRRKELGDCIQKQEELETRITLLQEVAVTTARMLGQEYMPEDAIGLTDAIRQVFKTAPNEKFNAVRVRARLRDMGLDISQYGNVLASIHTVLTRLEGRQIQMVSNCADGKFYVWLSKKD